MLFKSRFWAGLATGKVTLAFRRWRRPHAKTGSHHRFPNGVLAVDAVSVVDLSDISDTDALRAGFESRAELLRELEAHAEGDVYRIEFHFAGPDPREALRQSAALPASELGEVSRRLSRLDAASPRGPWTMAVLRLIGDHPGTRAADLAATLGRDKKSFKIDVRKLKELGLTESLEVGYQLSPRGRALLDRSRS
jgi:hypothetical protein